MINKKVIALYDYEATDPSELSFASGDIIIVLDQDEGGWWQGQIGDRVGFFPSNYSGPTWVNIEDDKATIIAQSKALIATPFDPVTIYSKILPTIQFFCEAQKHYGPLLRTNLLNDLIWPEIRITHTDSPTPTTPSPISMNFPQHILQQILVNCHTCQMHQYQLVNKEWFTAVHSAPVWAYWGRGWILKKVEEKKKETKKEEDMKKEEKKEEDSKEDANVLEATQPNTKEKEQKKRGFNK